MLELLGSMGLFLKPWTQGTDDGGKNADPAEPEKDQFCAMTVCRGWQNRPFRRSCRCPGRSCPQGRRMDSGGSSKAHIMPGDPDIDPGTPAIARRKAEMLRSASGSRPAGIQKSLRRAKNKETGPGQRSSGQLCSGWPIPIRPRRKFSDKNSHGKNPGIAFPFSITETERKNRIMEKGTLYHPPHFNGSLHMLKAWITRKK